jgi:CRP-like cAMP-binding protein
MERNALVQFLQATNLVSARAALEIADRFVEKKMDKNDFFLQSGKHSNEYFFLEAGFMRAYAQDTEGNEVTTNFYTANQVVFEVSSFFNRTISLENIQAITNCSGWVISYPELNELFHALPEFREFGRQILVKGFSVLKMRMLTMITESAEQRYAGLINANPEIFQYAPLKHIASYLGVTDTSLSRIRKQLSKK